MGELSMDNTELVVYDEMMGAEVNGKFVSVVLRAGISTGGSPMLPIVAGEAGSVSEFIVEGLRTGD